MNMVCVNYSVASSWAWGTIQTNTLHIRGLHWIQCRPYSLCNVVQYCLASVHVGLVPSAMPCSIASPSCRPHLSVGLITTHEPGRQIPQRWNKGWNWILGWLDWACRRHALGYAWVMRRRTHESCAEVRMSQALGCAWIMHRGMHE